MTEDNVTRCENCGTVMVHAIQDSIQGLRCPKCGNWGFITTYIPEIKEDQTIYEIHLISGKDSTIEKGQLKVISKICNCNYLEAEKKLSSEDICIAKVSAEEAYEIIKSMKDSGLSYTVAPDFKYL